MSKSDTNENTVTLKLTKWEIANLHLPPVTTVTLYQGDVPIDFLRQRLTSMLAKNPWISSRIIKKNTVDKMEALTFPKTFEASGVIDQHLSVYKSGDIGFSLDMPYQDLVRCLLPVQCARSKPATDTDEALFRLQLCLLRQEP